MHLANLHHKMFEPRNTKHRAK